jgi:hypothetical protein
MSADTCCCAARAGGAFRKATYAGTLAHFQKIQAGGLSAAQEGYVMSWTVVLGGNEITNCDAALVVNGVEVFRLRERGGDGQLVADFEIRDEADNLIAKVAKNNVVHARSGLQVQHAPTFSEVRDPTTGSALARAEEIGTLTIRLTGTFIIRGFRVVATEASLKINGLTMSGNKIVGFGKAIDLRPGQIGIGVSR